MPTALPAIDHDLHDALIAVAREHGPLDLHTLTRRARLALGRATLDEHVVNAVVERVTSLVCRPDGRISYLGDVLDGIVLTHRTRGPLDGRNDLWLGFGAQPFLTLACAAPLPLADGGEARIGETVDPVLVGPDGWLPPADPGDLIALTWRAGHLAVARIDEDDLAGPESEDHVRRTLGERCRTTQWWVDPQDDDAHLAILLGALAAARLEDPTLLSTPHAPLDQVLYDPLGTDRRNHWRDAAALRQGACVSFAVTGMPFALDRELRHRAERFGMTFDQFVITVLGHLAWRTPFAEDMEPWGDWLPEAAGRPTAPVKHLRLTDDDSAG